MSDLLLLAPEVRAAIREGRPVVALESSIIAHGLPWPLNLEVGQEMEAAVREEGAVPAVTALIEGQPRVGLTPEELQNLAAAPAAKASVRDLAPLAAAGATAATTVSSTRRLAHLASIPVMATGGIGGVHRGAAGDVSADLVELSRTPVTVVCSGAKSILDLPRTLERLETLGVPLVGYRTRSFPAFHSRSSGLPLEHSVRSVAALARIARCQRQLRSRAALLVVQPVPRTAQIPWTQLRTWVDEAVEGAKRAGVGGKEATPWLLSRVAELSGGRTLAANRALAVENCRLAARLSGRLRP